MTEPAQRVAIEPAEYRAFTDPPTADSGNLALSSNGEPVKVFVYTFTDTGSPVPGFASKRNATTFYTGGLQWSYPVGTTYALFVTFVFLQGTTTNNTPNGLKCQTYSYSEAYEQKTKADLCILATETPAPYPTFTVNYPTTSHDPQIVVTPQ